MRHVSGDFYTDSRPFVSKSLAECHGDDLLSRHANLGKTTLENKTVQVPFLLESALLKTQFIADNRRNTGYDRVVDNKPEAPVHVSTAVNGHFRKLLFCLRRGDKEGSKSLIIHI